VKSPLYPALTAASLVLIAITFFSPIWWVSLTAPNYPEATFPQGVRILLHFDGVYNGCLDQESEEVEIEEMLDCVEEMNTINHYIGMHPIERGAQIEFWLAPYLFVLLGALVAVSIFYTGPLWWVLTVPAMLLPVAFLIDFVAWLWWFGHDLHPWAAFTVKPFMPTVLGQGKVAQFSTFAYPHYGFGLALLSSLLLIVAVLSRRKQLQGAAAAE
jgi:hypothetical protein